MTTQNSRLSPPNGRILVQQFMGLPVESQLCVPSTMSVDLTKTFVYKDPRLFVHPEKKYRPMHHAKTLDGIKWFQNAIYKGDEYLTGLTFRHVKVFGGNPQVLNEFASSLCKQMYYDSVHDILIVHYYMSKDFPVYGLKAAEEKSVARVPDSKKSSKSVAQKRKGACLPQPEAVPNHPKRRKLGPKSVIQDRYPSLNTVPACNSTTAGPSVIGESIKVEPNAIIESPTPNILEVNNIIDSINSKGMQEAVVSKFSLHLTRGDLTCLYPENLLNDNIINYYIEMMQERSSKNPGLPTFHAFSTQFYDKLLKSGYQGVHKWTKKVDIFNKDLLLFPINYKAIHWILAVVNLRQKMIYLYNSAGLANVESCFEPILNYLSEEMRSKKKSITSRLYLDQVTVKCIPQQNNNYDCGVFILRFAESITRYGHHGQLDFTQETVPQLRNLMLSEIFNGLALK